MSAAANFDHGGLTFIRGSQISIETVKLEGGPISLRDPEPGRRYESYLAAGAPPLNPKIADHHLARQTCIYYIRQSTPAQVRFNQESTERQYNLANQARSLGWIPEQNRILDRDLAQSGELTTKRDDFKTLVSDVAMGQVGSIFSLEASRLARSNKDWHRLLELCAITKTLVFDGDGCYDPSDFNDSLVRGMKSTFAQAELHIIRARLQGGRLNKAQKGALRFPLPVGLVFRRRLCLWPSPILQEDQLWSVSKRSTSE